MKRDSHPAVIESDNSGEPATVVYSGARDAKIAHGYIHRPVFPNRLVKTGWHFDSPQTGRLWLRGDDEGVSWSRGYHDGQDLLAACKLVWSAAR